MRALLAALLVVPACQMGVFDDLRDQSSSDSHGAPDGISLGFGAAVAFVPSPENFDGMRFVVAGDNGPNLSTFVYDLDNDAVSSVGFDLTEFVTQLDTPPALTGVQNDFMGVSGGLVAFGIRQVSAVVLLDAGNGNDDRPPAEVATLRPDDCGLPPNMPGFGQRLVLAEMGIGQMAPELVVASGNELVLFEDVGAGPPVCSRCRLPDRALNIAGIDLGGGPALELVVAIDAPGQTDIALLEVNSAIIGASAGACDLANVFQIPEPAFADRIAVGNVDGDPRRDVIFAKRERDDLVVWLNLDAGPASNPVIVPTGVDIGDATSLAIANVDGEGGGEVLVGVPTDTLTDDAGRVDVFEVLGGIGMPPRLELRSQLTDSFPEGGQLYGRSLATGVFRRGAIVTQVPIIGADEEVFVVFQADPEGSDPR